MSITLPTFNASDTDYVQKLNSLSALVQDAVNAIQAAILTTLGEGAQLPLDLWDRDGVIGDHSYRLDIDAYDGGATILVGRRPAADEDLGDQDVSAAWGTFGDQRARVQQTGDVTLNAATIVAGLPKTIYVGVPSSGTAQLFEASGIPSVVYVYSMTWDGYSLTDFRRLAPILPAYPLIQSIAGRQQMVQVFDGDTDWLDDTESATEVVLPGGLDAVEDDNGEGLFDLAYEVVGFFCHTRGGENGFYAPTGSDPEENKVSFRVTSDGDNWTEDPFEFGADSSPDTIFLPVDANAVGDDRFVTELREFKLERVDVGDDVVSASGMLWGVVVRPIYGNPIAKDDDSVGQV